MLSSLFKKDPENFYCLQSSSQNWSKIQDFILIVKGFYKTKNYNLDNFYGWNERDKDFDGPIEKLLNIDASKLVRICLYDNANNESVNIKINIGLGPNVVSYVSTLQNTFDFKEYILLAKNYLLPDYGYSYCGIKGKSSQAYLYDQYHKPQYLLDISRKKEQYFDSWRANRTHVLNGKMRDVYQQNLLNESQVKNRLKNGQSLEEFIHSDIQHGVLEEIYEKRYFWSLEKPALENVRKKLYSESFLS